MKRSTVAALLVSAACLVTPCAAESDAACLADGHVACLAADVATSDAEALHMLQSNAQSRLKDPRGAVQVDVAARRVDDTEATKPEPSESSDLVAAPQRVRSVAESTHSMVQSVRHTSRERITNKAQRDLTLFHVPFNFGHTIERVALLGPNSSMIAYGIAQSTAGKPFGSKESRLQAVENMKQQEGEVWGRMIPDLNDISNVSGCVYAFTPPMYWPEAMAEKYLGGKRSFGMLRDPYERMVALFRGNFGDLYGGAYPEYIEQCDVDGAVKKMMQDYLDKGTKFADGCTFVPQAEYFMGKYGVAIPVDNRRFPDSFNELMIEHGYDHIQAEKRDIMHVGNCNEAWAGDLSCETRALVREVFAEDFKLLCDYFDYCDESENVCIAGVEDMCPHDTSKARTKCGDA